MNPEIPPESHHQMPGRNSGKLTQFPLGWISLAAVLGILTADLSFVPFKGKTLFIFLGILVVGVLGGLLRNFERTWTGWRWRKTQLSLVWPCLAIAGIFGLWHLIFLTGAKSFPWHAEIRAGGQIWVAAEGTLHEHARDRDRWVLMADRMVSRHEEKVQEYHGGKFQIFQVERVSPQSPDGIKPGDGARIRVEGWLTWPHEIKNRHQIDFGSLLESQGYDGRLAVISGEWLNPASPPSFSSRLRERIRTWILNGIDHEPQVGILTAMVLGEQGVLDEETNLAFRLSGTTHLFSVSGLHVGILGMMLWQLGGLMGIRRPSLAGWVILGMWIYTGLTGFPVSAIRASWMGSCMMLGMLLHRRSNVYQGLSFAVLLILVWDPRTLFQVGFQLSVGAVLGILWLHGRMAEPIQRWFTPDPYLPRQLWRKSQTSRFYVGGWVGRSLGVSTGATVGTALVMVHAFKILVPGGVLANMVMVPVAFPVMCCAVMSILLHALGLSWIGILVNQMAWSICKLLLAMAHFFSGIPLGSFAMGIPAWNELSPRSEARLEVFSMEKGAAIYLRAGRWKSEHWLIDSGPKAISRPVLLPFLKHQFVGQLQGLILTHRDVDHYGGASQLMNDLSVQNLFLPTRFNVSDLFDQELVTGRTRALNIHAMVSGDEWKILPNSKREGKWRVLFPPRDWNASNANDSSLVVKIEVAGWKIVVLNDAGVMASEWLKNHLSEEELRCDVLIFADLHPEWQVDWSWWLHRNRPRLIIASERVSQQLGQAFHALVNEKSIAFLNPVTEGSVRLDWSEEEMQVETFFSQIRMNIPK